MGKGKKTLWAVNKLPIEVPYEQKTSAEIKDRACFRPSFLCNIGVNTK
jgi:hypothetical protein